MRNVSSLHVNGGHEEGGGPVWCADAGGKYPPLPLRGGEQFLDARFLDKLKYKLSPVSVAAIIHDKKLPIPHRGYRAIRSFALGKRKIALLEPEIDLAQ